MPLLDARTDSNNHTIKPPDMTCVLYCSIAGQSVSFDVALRQRVACDSKGIMHTPAGSRTQATSASGHTQWQPVLRLSCVELHNPVLQTSTTNPLRPAERASWCLIKWILCSSYCLDHNCLSRHARCDLSSSQSPKSTATLGVYRRSAI